MSFYCIQKWNHGIKTTSTNTCMSPQEEFFVLILCFSIGTLLLGGFIISTRREFVGKFEILLNVKLPLSTLGCITTEQHARDAHPLAACITHSLPHKPWSKARNNVGR